MDRPLVSIFMFCKDRAHSVGRALDSVLAQSWPNIEIIVQDGASTDGTLEILKGYGDAIDLVSAPDGGSDDALLRALQRCRGKYIGSCLSDEELLPDAVERAVAYLEAHPQIGAITGDADIIDANGKRIGQHISADFVLQSYLTGDYCPYFVSSFFRRDAVAAIGAMVPGWAQVCVEFRLWCHLGANFDIDYVPGKFGRYGIHPGQLSNIPTAVDIHMDGRLAAFEEMFGAGGVLASEAPENPLLMRRLMAGQCVMQYNHLICNKLETAARRYLDLFLRQARHFARELAGLHGLAYDDDAVCALIAANPALIFGTGGADVLLDLLPPGRGNNAALAARAFPGGLPPRITLPPLAPALSEVLAQTLEHRGLARQAAHCRRLAA